MNSDRPPLLSFLCFLALVGCFFKMYYVFSGEIRNVNFWYPSYVSLSTIFVVVCLYNLMLMRKWSFWAFCIFFALHQFIQWWVNRWNLSVMILFMAIVVTSAVYYRRME